MQDIHFDYGSSSPIAKVLDKKFIDGGLLVTLELLIPKEQFTKLPGVELVESKEEIPPYPCSKCCPQTEWSFCCGCEKESKWQEKYGKNKQNLGGKENERKD